MWKVSILSGKSEEIRSVPEWFEKAPPAKGQEHWKDCRSAKELAKAWTANGEPAVPEDIKVLAKFCTDLRDETEIEAFAERKTRLDSRPGGQRNHDLLLKMLTPDGTVVVGIEAKADESFGQLAKQASNQERVRELSLALFGHENTGDLRYQLLYGVAGTLIEAKNLEAGCAVFLVHEFLSDRLESEKTAQNNGDYAEFASRLFQGKKRELDENTVYGPIYVKGNERVPNDIPLYMTKVQTHLRDCPKEEYGTRV